MGSSHIHVLELLQESFFHFFLTRGKAKAGECIRPGGWVPRNTSVLLGAIGVRRGYMRVIYGQIGLRV